MKLIGDFHGIEYAIKGSKVTDLKVGDRLLFTYENGYTQVVEIYKYCKVANGDDIAIIQLSSDFHKPAPFVIGLQNVVEYNICKQIKRISKINFPIIGVDVVI